MKWIKVISTIEILIFIIPGLVLSGVWLLSTGALVIEALLSLKGEYFNAGNLTFSLIHFLLGALSHAAVWTLLLIVANRLKRSETKTLELSRVKLSLILTGLAITTTGLVFNVAVRFIHIKGDALQAFPIYSIGVVVLIPALHVLYICRASRFSDETDSSTR